MRRYTVRVNGSEYVVDVDELDAESFEVTVGGRTLAVELAHDVNLDEASITPAMSDGAAPGPAPAFPVPPPARLAPIAARPGPPAPASTSLITAPLPGVIVSVNVAEGDPVSRGQTLLTLEAMKMCNSIRSPRDGTVVAVHVAAGQSIAHGEALVDVKEKR